MCFIYLFICCNFFYFFKLDSGPHTWILQAANHNTQAPLNDDVWNEVVNIAKSEIHSQNWRISIPFI